MFSVQFIYLLIVTVPFAASAPVEDNNIFRCTDETTCNSESCTKASADVLKFINTTINPCDDFYNFACGGYLQNHVIPDDQLEVSPLHEIHDEVFFQLHSALLEPFSETEPRAWKLAKKLFQVCSDTDTIERNGLKTIKSLVKSFGGWPVVEGDEWNEETFDWKELVYKLRKSGLPIGHLVNTRVEQNVKDASRRIFSFGQANLPVHRLNLMHGMDDPALDDYYDYFVSLAKIFGARTDYAESEFRHFFYFLLELGQISVPPEELRNITAMTNIMKIEEFQQKFSGVDWLDYINNIIAHPEVKLTDQDLINVYFPIYFGKLLQLINRTPKRVLANYIITVSLTSIDVFLNQVTIDNYILLLRRLSGQISKSARWRECVGVTQRLKVAIAAVYARKYFNDDAKSNVVSIVTNLFKKFLDVLEKVDWMDERTRDMALEKAKNIQMHIAYPQELLNDTALDNYYKNLNSSKDYLQYVLNIQTFSLTQMYKSLTEPVSKSDWTGHSVSHVVNAFYHRFENAIIVPAAFLQGVMFGNDRPNYMNYGRIGFVAGHEITHGFDDTGKQIGKDGQLENWWTYGTENSYTEKAQCIIKQYSNFTFDDLKLNGIITLDENIADNGGIKIAYDAYQELVSANQPEKCLPNLNYTPNQMFWISYANAFCTKERIESLESKMSSTSHPPSMLRIYGVVSNSKNFSKDFNCPVGSNMNPIKKCTFW